MQKYDIFDYFNLTSYYYFAFCESQLASLHHVISVMILVHGLQAFVCSALG